MRQLIFFLGLLGILLGSAAWARAEEEAPPTPRWTYRVRFEPDLQSAKVLVTFRGWYPKRLILARTDALAALQIDALPDGTLPYRPNPARNGILPRIVKDGDGLLYKVDFRKLARITADRKQSRRVGHDLVTRAGLFLLHPALWPESAQVRVILELPSKLSAAVPWVQDSGPWKELGQPRYVLPKHAMVLHAPIAFGRFEPQRVEVPGGDLMYYTLDAPHRASDAGIARWLRASMGAVADLFGGAPVRRTHVLVQPLVPGRGRPVVFGRATLSGGPMVHVMLSGTAKDAELPGEWMTIHEMIHLGMPVTNLADRWFGEGFVSYYQEVVRARAGFISPQQAWQNLHDWMQRGKQSGGRKPLGDESRLMTNTYAYHRVYWGGAAIALKLDLSIRSATKGHYALDDVMRWLHEHDVTPGTVIDALELMRHGDEFLGVGRCTAYALQALASKAFPPLEETYERLGLRVTKGRISLVADAPDAKHRDAIMRRGGR